MRYKLVVLLACILAKGLYADVERIMGTNTSLSWVWNNVNSSRIYKDTVKIADNYKASVVLKDFQDGNGYMEVGGLTLHISDGHSDGIEYKNSRLDVEFVDLDRDGYKDLICSGIVEYKNDGDEVYKTEDVIFIYRFDSTKKQFTPLFKKASFDLEWTGEKGSPIRGSGQIQKSPSFR